jgi:tetratricopeptide (TPR) repeat protein
MRNTALLLLLTHWLGAQSIEERFDKFLDQCKVARQTSRFQEAERYCREAEVLAKAWPDGDVRHLRLWNQLAMTLTWLARYGEAQAIFEAALPAAKKASPQAYLSVAVNLAAIYRVQGRLRDADRLLRAALRAEGAAGLPDALMARSLLAGINVMLGAYKAARSQYEEVLAAQTRSLGPGHTDTLATLHDFTSFTIRRKRYQEAERLALRYIEDSRKTYVPGYPTLAFGHHQLGVIYTRLGLLNEAAEQLDRAMAILEHAVGKRDPHIAVVLHSLARLDLRRGDLALAHSRLEQTISISGQTLGLKHPFLAVVLRTYGDILRRQGMRVPAREALARANSIEQANARDNGAGQSIDVSTLRLESAR